MTNRADEQYLALCDRILSEGHRKDDRTGTGTLSVFGAQMRFDLAEGFPLLTTKRVPFRIIAEELLWFLRGSTDVGELIRRNVNIWNADAYRHLSEKIRRQPLVTFDDFIRNISIERGGFDLGPIYGAQWRSWGGADYGGEFAVDQIAQVIESIRTNPDSRRHIVSAWNVGELEEMALPPCHTLFQFYVTPPSSEGANGKLSCQLYQRSGDVFLGVPFNIASYALLTHMIADITGLEVGELVHTLGDAHIYTNHIEQVREQMTREPKELPKLSIKRKVEDPAEYSFEDFEIIGYNPHPAIKGEVSVGL